MLTKTIFDTVFDRVRDTLVRPDVPVNNTAANEVARQITAEVAPIVVNATNSEHWTQSRIFRGLLVAGIGYLGSKVGLVIGENDVAELIGIGSALFEAGGLLYAWYGRVVGASKKPIGQ